MKNILAILAVTLSQTRRDKNFLNFSLLAIIFVFFVFLISGISLDQDKKIIIDFGLAGLLFLGIIFVIVTSLNFAQQESSGVLQLILVKPILHRQYLGGKFLGLAANLLIVCLIIVILITLGYLWRFHELLPLTFYLAALAEFCEILIIIGIMQLFSAFSRPTNSAFYTAALAISGHSYDLILLSAKETGQNFLIILTKVFYYFLPNFDKFNWRLEASYDLSISGGQIIYVIVYTLSYSLLLLIIASYAFQKRQF